MSARADFVSAFLMMGIAIVFFVTATTIEVDPHEPGIGSRAVPMALALLICLLSLCLIARSFRAVRQSGWALLDRDELDLFVAWVLPMAAIAIGYVVLIDMFQYLLPTVVVTAATLALFGNRGKTWLLATPVAVGLAYYVVFFGLLRLLESPGTVIEYENNIFFGPLRKLLGL
jgi:hypothetical protein